MRAAAQAQLHPAPAAVTVPKVTAIVLNWCGHDDTAACLRSLLASDYPALRILLVDNGSPDGSGASLHAEFPDIPFLQTGRNLGYTGGNNQGIRLALEEGADYVLVLNNDTVVEPGCVSALVEAATAGGAVGAVGAKILFHDAPDRIWFAGGDLRRERGMAYHRREGELDRPAEETPEDVSFLTGCCLLLPARVVREVGAFEEGFFAYIEDVDLSLRLLERGFRLVYQPQARMYHRVPLEPQLPSPFLLVLRDRNRRRLVERHYGRLERLRFSLFFYPSRLVRLAQYLVRGDLARAGAVWKGMTIPADGPVPI